MSIKTEYMQPAATLAAGVISNFPDDLAVDPTLQDSKLNAAVLAGWEVARSYYHGFVKAEDSGDWPEPESITKDLSNNLMSLISKFSDNPKLADAIKKLAGDLIEDTTDEIAPELTGGT